MGQAIYTRWKCGRCQHWNLIEKSHCAKCGGGQATYAAVYRDEQKLTIEEEQYYNGTAPKIARTLDQMNSTLARIEELLEEAIGAKSSGDDS